MSINNAPIIANPVMIDKVIGNIQIGLVEHLGWLDAAFGRAQRLVKKFPGGKEIATPNVYCGGWKGYDENDYIEVSPDSHIGNFSFFIIDDPQELGWERGVQMTQKAPFSLVFWFDLRRVFRSETNRNTEYLKAQILEVLNGRTGWILRDGRITINRCWEQAKNIYKGYSLDEVDNQYLMHPFGGFRFDGIMEIDMPCELPDINR